MHIPIAHDTSMIRGEDRYSAIVRTQIVATFKSVEERR
jgi:hypothetical protein